jgi:hypothetical protein
MSASIIETPLWTINVFPNPTDYILNINVENSFAKEFTWEIFDLNGATVLQSNNSIFIDGNSTLQVGVEQLVPSTYFLRMYESTSQPYIIKFIKK